jgi:hypothetical protein
MTDVPCGITCESPWTVEELVATNEPPPRTVDRRRPAPQTLDSSEQHILGRLHAMGSLGFCQQAGRISVQRAFLIVSRNSPTAQTFRSWL